MRIQHNIPAMSAYRNYTNNVAAMKKNLEKLSSGYKINRAGDDAAGLAISEKMRAQITGLETAQKNAKDGISLVQTAEGALTEVHDMLNRMVELASMSANGTYDNTTDRAQLQKEMDQLKAEINRIADSSNFNGINLLDGSMDSKADLTKFSDKLQIAEWVGSTQNSLADVGDGTIVHNGQQEAKATTFSVELNNSTVTGDKGVSITIGDNEALTLTADEISEGASADEIAAAIASKYGKDGVDFLAEDGTTKVNFDVKAQGDKIVFTQKEMPKNASEIVGSKFAIKYEGIGAVSESNSSASLNTGALTVTAPGTNNTGVTAQTFKWADGATAEQRNALNKLIEDNTTATTTVSIDVIAKTGATAKKVENYSVDITSLQKALGDGYTVTAKIKDGAEVKADEVDPNIFNLANAANASNLQLTISDKDGNAIGMIDLALTGSGTDVNGAAAANTDYKGTFTLGQGTPLNTNPTSTFKDDGNMLPAAVTTGTANAFVADGGITAKQQNAFNELLGEKGLNISFQLSDLAGNATQAGSKIKITFDQALTDAGYTLKIGDGTNETEVKAGKDISFATAAAAGVLKTDATATLKIYDKDGNAIGAIALDLTAANTKLNTGVTTVTLNRSNFTADATETGKVLAEKAAITMTDKDGNAITVDNWASATAGDGADLAKDGSTMSIDIEGKTYTVTFKGSGLSEEEKASGKFIDLSDNNVYNGTNFGVADTKPASILAAFQGALRQQLANAAKEGALGTEDYKSYANLTLATGATPDTNTVKITANVTNHSYSIAGNGTEEAGAVPGGISVNGGKDPNASTTHNTTGQIADAGRLASTFITNDMLEGLKDGSQFKVGDVTYTFAVGKDSKVTGDNVIDLRDMTAADKDLVEKAMERLSHADNEMFSIGYDKGRVTFTENKEYKWGEGVDLSTRDGIAEQFAFSVDGKASGKSLTLQIGDTADEYNQLKVNIADCHVDAIGIGDASIADQESAAKAVDAIKSAINYVSAQANQMPQGVLQLLQ